MNPHATIKPWLKLCSVQGGIGAVEVFETDAVDMSGKEEEIHFVFSVDSGKHSTDRRGSALPIKKKEEAVGYDVEVTGYQPWIWNVTVDLLNSQNGLSELAGCAIAAETDQDIRNLFKSKGVSFVSGSAEVENESKRDGDRHYYHHVLTCQFVMVEGYTHRKINHRVETIDTDDAVTLVTE